MPRAALLAIAPHESWGVLPECAVARDPARRAKHPGAFRSAAACAPPWRRLRSHRARRGPTPPEALDLQAAKFSDTYHIHRKSRLSNVRNSQLARTFAPECIFRFRVGR